MESGLITLGRGKVISKKDMAATPGRFPVYSSARMNNGRFGEYGLHMFDEELITWSVDGGGRLFYRPRHKFSVTNVGGTLRINDTHILGYKFLYYYLTLQHSRVAFDWVRKAHPSIIRKLYKGIPTPPLPEQERIVAILDEVLEAVDTAIANTERKLASARELFGRRLNSVLVEGATRWAKKDLGEICRITSKLVDPRDEGHLDLLHVGAGNMISKTGEMIDVRTAREEGLKSVKFLFDNSMVLYSKIRPYLMKVCQPSFGGLCSADVYPLAPVESDIMARFLFYVLLTDDFTEYAVSGSARAGMPKVNKTHLFAYRVGVPPLSEQASITDAFDELSALIGRLEKTCLTKIRLLEQLRRSILQKAFSSGLGGLPLDMIAEAQS